MKTQIYLPSFTQGVSQQTDKLKLPTQVKEVVNGYPSLLDGLVKRPPTEHIKKILDGKLPNSYSLIFSKDTNEKYILIINNDGIKIFDLEGNLKEIKSEIGFDYIKCDNPQYDLITCIVGEHIFILNKKVKAKMIDEDYPNPYPNSALIYVKQGNIQADYKIFIDDVEKASYATSNEESTCKTNNIASNLSSALIKNLPADDWNISLKGSVILLQNKKGNDFDISVQDSNGERSLFCFKSIAETVDDLPNVAPADYIVKILNNRQNSSDDYWVRFKPNKEDVTKMTSGNWIECPCPGVKYKFDNTTLPHALVKNEDNTFSFIRLDYTQRRCGDDNSAALPNFINNTITDILVYKARLCFLSADRYLASDPTDIYSFCKETTITELDSDPIDIPASNINTANLLYALPFNKDLILFSKKQQHVLSTSSILSNKTIGIGTITNFECSEKVKPVSSGSNMYFAYEKGDYTGIREFFIDQSQALDADDTTLHVSNFIPKNVFNMTVSTLENNLILQSEETADIIYLYKFFYQNAQKQQSAWVKWELNANIIKVNFIDNILYMLIQYNDGLYFEKIDFTANRYDINYSTKQGRNIQFNSCLDRKVIIEDCEYKAENDITIIKIPYLSNKEIVVIDENGQEIDVIESIKNEDNTTTLKLSGFYSKVVAGINYSFYVKLPTIYLRDESGLKVIEGDLQLLDIQFSLSKTGFLRVDVTPLYADTMTYEYDGKILDTPACELDTTPITNDVFNVPIFSLNKEVEIELRNDTYLPVQIIDAVVWADFIRE